MADICRTEPYLSLIIYRLLSYLGLNSQGLTEIAYATKEISDLTL